MIENGLFNLLTRDHALTHNYHHNPTAIVALLLLRSLAMCFTMAYWRYATARTERAPPSLLAWWALLIEDWVRYLDRATAAPRIALVRADRS